MSPDTYAILGTIWLGVGILERTLWGKVLIGLFAFYWIAMWVVFR